MTDEAEVTVEECNASGHEGKQQASALFVILRADTLASLIAPPD
jgi:hypothetical protein